MGQLKNELLTMIERSTDSHLRLAVTGLSRSGKTAFISSFVNQLLNINNGARLPLFSVFRDKRLRGIKREPQQDLSIPRFAYDESLQMLCGESPTWPQSTQGISEIRLLLRFEPESHFSRLINRTILYLDIFDYPGEWLLDLPMLTQDYLLWSQQMLTIQQHGMRKEWAAEWTALCQQCDPLAPADEQLLATIAGKYTDYLLQCKKEGYSFIQPGRFVLPGDLAGAPVIQFFPWPTPHDPALMTADRKSNFAMLQKRYEHYCQTIVHAFYQNYFLRFDRQIVLADCLQPLNQGAEIFTDMQMALSGLMQSFHYGKRTLFRRLFSPHIDKLMFAATKADHVTADQHSNLVSLLKQLVNDAQQHASFEGIQIDYAAIAAVQATDSGIIEHQGERMPVLKGQRLEDGEPLLVFPGSVPATLPSASFWQKQSFHFDQFRPKSMNINQPLPHIRLDNVMEFLLGDILR